jgi:hypothetical protein
VTSQKKREIVLHWHERGIENAAIVRLLGIPIDEVRAIIHASEHPALAASAMPLFIQPPVFGGGDDSLVAS